MIALIRIPLVAAALLLVPLLLAPSAGHAQEAKRIGQYGDWMHIPGAAATIASAT